MALATHNGQHGTAAALALRVCLCAGLACWAVPAAAVQIAAIHEAPAHGARASELTLRTPQASADEPLFKNHHSTTLPEHGRIAAPPPPSPFVPTAAVLLASPPEPEAEETVLTQLTSIVTDPAAVLVLTIGLVASIISALLIQSKNPVMKKRKYKRLPHDVERLG